MDTEAADFAEFMETTRIQAAQETHSRLEADWLREYAVHAPITYKDAHDFLTNLGHPFTRDDTMRVLAEMRRKYAEEMLRAMRKVEATPASKRTCNDEGCCYHGQPTASSCMCHEEE